MSYEQPDYLQVVQKKSFFQTDFFFRTLGLLMLGLFFLVSRFYEIGQNPVSLYWDEASIGYNAFAILETGRDEWGEFLPIHFKAFGEYKLPVYIYSVAISESLFGLTTFAVRLPALLFSFGSLLLLYAISIQLTKSHRVGFFSSFLFIITPWFFLFSRTGYEVSAGLFFFLLGLYFFFLYKKSLYFLISAVACFLLALYSYNSFRILIPLIGVLLGFYMLVQSYEEIKRGWKIVVFGLILFLVGCLPIVNLYTSDGGLKRFSDVGIYHNGDSKTQAVGVFVSHYLSHFSPQYLFLSGDENLRSHTGSAGEFFWIQSIFMCVGFVIMCWRLLYLRDRNRFSCAFFLLGLLVIAPIPAALTRESPHALRSVLLLVPLTILSAIGIVSISEKVRFRNFFLGFVVFAFSFLFCIYYYKFITEYPTLSATSWQYEYNVLFSEYGLNFHSYDTVIVSEKYAQPYIFYLFTNRVSPKLFQEERVLNSEPRFQTSAIKQVGNVSFSDIEYSSLPKGRLLIFAHPEEKMEELSITKTIWNPDKTVAFLVYEYENK